MPLARAQRGIALVTAVMIVAIAAAIAVQIAFAHQIWFRQMENVADRDATDWLRRGALHWASLALLEDAAQNSIDHLGEPWAIGLPILPVEGGTIKVSIEDAQSRFNLNSVVNVAGSSTDPVSQANLQILKRLLESLRLDPSLADSLVDWIDTDSNALPGGAEDVYYLNLDPPYRAANRPMASVDELRLVRGFDAKTVAALLPYVTVLPPGAVSEINLNTASPVVLAALVQGLDLPTAQRIAENRLGKPYNKVDDFKSQLPPAPPGLAGAMNVKTDYFLVTIDTSIGRHERHSEALLKRDAAARVTTWIWHRPQPLIGELSSGSDEPDKSQ
ncbi:MAG TPA: type II secretion system minor pseudopilin GspK [Burkholderiales bacterium]|jgi:general secretion pathway protein K|nr:type II secretion system minor pseudopilin GspK [Burkholderiales bacterium]